jgi:hypothetical protein
MILTDRRGRSRRARVLLVILLATVLASGVFIVTHAHHDCIGLGHGCHTCIEISLCEMILGGLGLAAFFLTVAASVLRGALLRCGSVMRFAAGVVRRVPLFSDSVRLNL